MSLVICSNNESDEASRRQDSSVYKAWSFRNDLSSTYTIPPNSQVALQSCKVNIDGRVSVSSANNKFYTFFGKKLNRNGKTAPQMKDTTSHPVLVDISGGQNQVLELSKNDFANQVQTELRSATYHPDVKGKPTVEVLQNASSLDFKGYKITMDQNLDRDNTIPANGEFHNYYYDFDDTTDSDFFTYNNGVFTRKGSNGDGCVGISKQLPLTTTTGLFVVNVSGTNANANASGVEWHVGLSRSVNDESNGYYVPAYASISYPDTLNCREMFFADFAVGVNQAGQLIAYHWQARAIANYTLVRKEVQYWNNASSDYAGSGRADISGDNITDVRFTVEGERVKVELYNAASAAWLVVTEYNPAATKPSMFKPVLQTCWCLHPVLSISDRGHGGQHDECSMEITHFDTPRDLTDYDPTVFQKGGWWESMEIIGRANDLCFSVDSRSLFSFGPGLSTVYQQRGVNASNGVDYDDPVFIFQPSEIYAPSPGANATELLGFNALVDTATSNPSLSKYIYESVNIPSLVSPLSLFVRLDNLGQNSFNARSKNKSKILAHLTTLENKVGRQTYEPSNLVYIDLDNPYELKLTSFDISFTYINEQFATILTGQSIVSLLFRQKSKGEY